jgi:hypothetical protein
MAPQHAGTCAEAMPPHEEQHGQRRLRSSMSGGWASGCACSADGAALEERSRIAARHAIGMTCHHRLLGDRPQQRRFDRGQPEGGLDQRQARQDAEGRRLGWPQSGCRLLPLEVSLRDERFWEGGNRRQMNRQGWTREGSNRQESSETCCKAATQLPCSMSSPADKHSAVSYAADGPESGSRPRPATRKNGAGHGRRQVAQTGKT